MEDFNQLFDDDLFEINKVEEKTIKLKHGERRMVSILFADIKGFTALSEVLDHEEVQTLIDQLMKIFSHCVEIHGGYVDKYTGDQIMALFGAKKASEVDTQRSINTALLMLEKLKKFNVILSKSKKYENLNVDFSIRVGINTGMVTTGAVGKEREGDYTVYGDAVNLASRMESNAPLNSIMIPEETMLLVEDYFIFKDNSTIEVKGKSKPISVFLVKSTRDLSNRHSSPFIGREKEIKILQNAYNNIKSNIKENKFNKINFIGVTAEAGIGKTRLIQEYLNNNKNVSFSLSHASNISSKPYYIFISMIKDIFKISEMDSAIDTKNKFEEGINYLINNNKSLNHELKSAMPFIGFLIGISYNDERLKDRNEIQNHLNLSIKILIKAICYNSNQSGHPYIILLDDIHWIDKMSLDMFEYIINTLNVENSRNDNNDNAFSQLLIFATYRNEFSIPESFKDDLNFKEIHLSPLKKEDSIELIKYSTEGIDISNQTILDLIDKSKGNPFFIEEWICLLKEKHKASESIDESRGIKNVYEIPKSINSLILARIDNLEKTLKLLLQKATIIGEDFFVQILSQLEKKLGMDDDIDKPVHNLEDEDFIHHYINQLDHYKFKHMLTRDVAYSTILISNKIILHKAVAEIIEDYFSDKLEVFYFDLAIHYDISENYDKALKYLYLAGQKHSQLFDYKHSMQCFKRILKIVESQKDYKDILKEEDDSNKIYNYYINSKIKLAETLLDTSQWDDALTLYKQILNHKIKSKEIKYNLYRDLGQYYNYKRNYQESKDYLNKALKIASNNNQIATIKGKLGDCEYDIGNFDEAIQIFNEELSLFNEVKDSIGIALSHGHLGSALLQKGNLDQSLQEFQKSYEISKENDSRKMVCHALGNIALIYNIRGQYNKSLEIYKEVIATTEDIYDLRGQAQTYGNLGIIHKNLNEYDKSEVNYNKQLKIANKNNDEHMKSKAYSGFGVLYQKMGQFDKSIDCLNKAIDIQKTLKDNNELAGNLCNLSLSYFDLGNMSDAKNNLDLGMKLFKDIGNQRALNIGNFEMANFLRFEDKYDLAIEILVPSINFFEEIGDTVFLLRSLIQLGVLQRLNKDSKNAIKTLEKSLEIANKIDSNIFIETVNIELNICNLKKSIDQLKKQVEKTTDLSVKAYINFNIYKNTNDKDAKLLAEKDYKALYSKSKKFEYKYYLNKLK